MELWASLWRDQAEEGAYHVESTLAGDAGNRPAALAAALTAAFRLGLLAAASRFRDADAACAAAVQRELDVAR